MYYKKLVASVILCLMAGFIGSFFTSPAIPGWYQGLTKPDFNPPSWVFAPVWTTLYILMGIALYLVWDKGFAENKLALGVFGVQLILNTLWSILFFGMQNILYALVEITALWIMIVASIILFYKVDKRAAYLLVPYLLWVSFASFLNYTLWTLN